MAQIEASLATQGGLHKRVYSAAFAQNPAAPGSPKCLSPVSKLIKEQQRGQEEFRFSTPSRATTPAELECSLRRLSVAGGASHETSLFLDSPVNDHAPPKVPLHEVTLQANRLMSLPSPTHRIVAKLFPDACLHQIMSACGMVNDVQRRVFRSEEHQLVLSTPSLKSASDGVDRLINELNQISGNLKSQFKSLLAYLERHPEEAQARSQLALSFTK